MSAMVHPETNSPDFGESSSARDSSDQRKAVYAILGTIQLYAQDELPEAAWPIYADRLMDVQPKLLNSAAERWIHGAKDRWFPSIGKLRELATEAEHGQAPGWWDAWFLVLRAAREWNEYDRDACFRARAMLSDELYDLMYAITGGFYNLSLATKQDLGVWESQFAKAWTGQKDREQTRLALPESLQPAVQKIGHLPDDVKRLTSALPEAEFEEHRRGEIRKLAEHALKKADEPVPLKKRPTAADRPENVSRDEQLRAIREWEKR